jgi:5,10-methylenetetrahydromethanopterin reductase
MRLSVNFDGFASASEMLELAREAEDAGVDSLWFAQHMGLRDALVSAGAAAAVTRRVRLVPLAITPYLWPPLPVAMAMATLEELAPDRVTLAISVGNLLNLEQSGVQAIKPVGVTRRYVDDLRRLLAGEALRTNTEVYVLRGAKMDFQAGMRIPIYVASTGPKMLRLAGEIGDGIVLSSGLTLASCRKCLAHVDAGARANGRDIASIHKAGLINLCVSHDGPAARTAARRKLAYLFRSPGHKDNIVSSGLDIDHNAIMAAHTRHDLDAAVALLPEKAVDAFAVAGTPAQCRARLEELLSVGLDEPILSIAGNSTERRESLDFVRNYAQK